MSFTDEEIVSQLHAWARAEADGTAEKLTVMMGPFTAWVLIALLQLVWRHPDLTPMQAQVITDIAGQLQQVFSGPMAEAMATGWDKTQDVELPKRQPGQSVG